MTGPRDGWWVLVSGLKIVILFAATLILVMALVYIERKVVAFMQVRIGPNRAGPKGTLQTLADGIKLFFKEPVTPRAVDKPVYILAPLLSLIPMFLVVAIIPFGDSITVNGREIFLQGTDLNIGILFFLAMSSIGVYGITLAGWASGSKYPLIGGIRASAQMISYETCMGLALIPAVMTTGTLSMRGMVEAQSGTWLGFVPKWTGLVQVIPMLAFFICAVAETNRPPFDLVEAETELVGGFHTEYSGIRFAIFYLAEFANMFTISAIAVTVFLGGWNGPGFSFLPWLWPLLWFFAKTGILVFIFMWTRASLPRFRYDQLMSLGWKRLIPVLLVWLLVSSGVQAWINETANHVAGG